MLLAFLIVTNPHQQDLTRITFYPFRIPLIFYLPDCRLCILIPFKFNQKSGIISCVFRFREKNKIGKSSAGR